MYFCPKVQVVPNVIETKQTRLFTIASKHFNIWPLYWGQCLLNNTLLAGTSWFNFEVLFGSACMQNVVSYQTNPCLPSSFSLRVIPIGSSVFLWNCTNLTLVTFSTYKITRFLTRLRLGDRSYNFYGSLQNVNFMTIFNPIQKCYFEIFLRVLSAWCLPQFS